MTHQLAQINIGRLAAGLDSPQLAAFVDNLDAVNAIADAAPGFVWRLQTEDGNATDVVAFQWDDVAESAGLIVNMSVWQDVPSLTAYVYGEAHRAIMRRRREFFLPMAEAYTACWWVPSGHRPATDEAEDRIRYLRAHGPTEHSFTLRRHFPPPGASASRATADDRSSQNIRRSAAQRVSW